MEHTTRSRLSTYFAIGIGVVGIGLILGWWLREPAPGVQRLNELLDEGSSKIGDNRAVAQMTTLEIAAWRAPKLAAVVTEPIDGGSTVESVMTVLDRGTLPGQTVLSPSEMTALLRSVAEDLCARANPSIDAYLRLAERQGTRWLAPSDDDILWMRIGSVHEALFKAPVDRRQSVDACRRILEKSRELEKSQLAAIGTGEFGISIRAYVAKHESDLSAWQLDNDDQRAYWELTSTLATLVFRVPQPTAAECIHRSGSLKVATVAIVCDSAGGRRYLLVYTWFLDKESGRWLLHEVQMKGRPAHSLVY